MSRITVRNAVLALTARGLFERSVGQETFVKRKQGRPSAPPVSTGTLGYVVCKEKSARKPIASEAFYFDVFAGIEEVTSRSGRHTLFTYLDDFDPEELEGFRAFLGKVDGLVLDHPDPDAANTRRTRIEGEAVQSTLPPLSWNVIRVGL